MAISASTYRKILSIKTWATNKLLDMTFPSQEDINNAINTVEQNLDSVKSTLQTNIDTITGAMTNLTEGN